MKLEIDPTVRPEFETYHATFEGGALGDVTEVWVCKTSNYFGITQTPGTGCGGKEEDTVILDRENLLKLQGLVNQAVQLLEK